MLMLLSADCAMVFCYQNLLIMMTEPRLLELLSPPRWM